MCQMQAMEDAAKLMAEAKGQYGNGVGEERSLLITPIVALREYAEALEAGGQPQPKKMYHRPDGQAVVEVLPKGCLSGCLAGINHLGLDCAQLCT